MTKESMGAKHPTLQDVWKLLGTMNKRFDSIEREMVDLKTGLRADMAALEARLESKFTTLETRMTAGFGALKASIEARDFRLDEHGRRLNELEQKI